MELVAAGLDAGEPEDPREDPVAIGVGGSEPRGIALAGGAVGEGAAMAQLRSRGYADKYRHLGQPVHLVAVEFSRDARNLVAFEAVQVER